MSLPNADPARSPGGSGALESLAADPSWLAARDRLAASIRATSLPTYGGQARLRVAARQENR